MAITPDSSCWYRAATGSDINIVFQVEVDSSQKSGGFLEMIRLWVCHIRSVTPSPTHVASCFFVSSATERPTEYVLTEQLYQMLCFTACCIKQLI